MHSHIILYIIIIRLYYIMICVRDVNANKTDTLQNTIKKKKNRIKAYYAVFE